MCIDATVLATAGSQSPPNHIFATVGNKLLQHNLMSNTQKASYHCITHSPLKFSMMDFSTSVLALVTRSDGVSSSKNMGGMSSAHSSLSELHHHAPSKNFKSLESTDTAITTSTSSDEFDEYDIPESCSYDTTEAPKRHRYERSLTDHEYNLFLDFLESPSCNTPKRMIPDHVITDQNQSPEELDFLDSPTRNSSNTCFFTHNGCTDDEIIVPSTRKTHTNQEGPALTGCHDIMALSALAALLGSNIQPQEKQNRKKRNLWADDFDDEMISIPDL